MNNEEWRDIPGYEGYYQVSNRGRVRSIDRTTMAISSWDNKMIYRHYRGSIKKITLKSLGYMQVTLAKEGLHKRELVHRIVALAFIDNPLNKPEINHIDGNKSNNEVDNLEWVTSSENQIHANNVLGCQAGENHPLSKFKNIEIPEIIKEYNTIKNYRKIANKYMVAPSTIRRIIIRKTYKNVVTY